MAADAIRDKSCKNCKFIMVGHMGKEHFCRRYPPTEYHKFIKVSSFGWCGEWKKGEKR